MNRGSAVCRAMASENWERMFNGKCLHVGGICQVGDGPATKYRAAEHERGNANEVINGYEDIVITRILRSE